MPDFIPKTTEAKSNGAAQALSSNTSNTHTHTKFSMGNHMQITELTSYVKINSK
jgi:hypothetical protein